MQFKQWGLFVRQLGVCNTFLSVVQEGVFTIFEDSSVELYNNDTDCSLNHFDRDSIVIHNSVSSK